MHPAATGDWRFPTDTNLPPIPATTTLAVTASPTGRVFYNTSLKQNENWTITASHELLEMLVNPYAILSAYVPFDDNCGTFYRLEICDPVSPDENGYKINGIDVSDFVFPEWFAPYIVAADPNQKRQVDHCRRLTDPAPAIVPGTTISLCTTISVSGWRSVQSPIAAGQARAGKVVASLHIKRKPFGSA